MKNQTFVKSMLDNILLKCWLIVDALNVGFVSEMQSAGQYND